MRVVLISASIVFGVGLIAAVFHDTPLVLSMWHVVQALGNVLSAINGAFTKR